MKRPSLRFNTEAVFEWLLRHAEKLVVACVAGCAAWLLWGAIDALRSKSVGAGQMPDVISRKAAEALAHLDRVAEPPAELLPEHQSLSAALDTWRPPLFPWRSSAVLELADAPAMTPLDKPLFDELAKRPKPEILPLENLRASAGIAVLAAKSGDSAAPGAEATAAAPAGRIVPYVVVTGLIPAGKQRDEYRRRFADVGFPDAKRDSPLWSDFEIDRAVVDPGGKEAWERIDLAAARNRAGEWEAEAPSVVPAEYLLSAAEDVRSRQTTPLPFCGPLPQRIDEGWKAEQMHPWVWERMRTKDQPPPAAAPGKPAGGDADPAADGPGFGPTAAAATPAVAPVRQAGDGKPQEPEFRLFRFLDTAVEQGKTYRYRVRLKVWNPNWKLPEQHLVDAAFATDQKLVAPVSDETTAVRVPESMSLLARTIRAADQKRMRMKPDMFEVLVLAESRRSGGYALRSLLSYVGGVANVDSKLNKPPADVRCRGEDIETKWVLVDVLGSQVDRADVAAAKGPKQIGEQLDMLFLRPDGTFAVVSAAESEKSIGQYAATLSDADDGKRETRQTGQDAPPADRGANPFGPPRAP